MFVKICGISRLEDARAALDAGADAIGFNFWSPSPRAVSLQQATTIAEKLAKDILRVGVFVNPTRDEVEQAFSSGAIVKAQFHGDETPEFCQQFAGRYWKAIGLRDEQSLARLSLYDCDRFVIDSDTPMYGGSGLAPSVALAAQAAARHSVILAGGLTADNVATAIASVQPFGVDVASGVESAPGKKDHKKVAAFVHAAKGSRC